MVDLGERQRAHPHPVHLGARDRGLDVDRTPIKTASLAGIARISSPGDLSPWVGTYVKSSARGAATATIAASNTAAQTLPTPDSAISLTPPKIVESGAKLPPPKRLSHRRGERRQQRRAPLGRRQRLAARVRRGERRQRRRRRRTGVPSSRSRGGTGPGPGGQVEAFDPPIERRRVPRPPRCSSRALPRPGLVVGHRPPRRGRHARLEHAARHTARSGVKSWWPKDPQIALACAGGRSAPGKWPRHRKAPAAVIANNPTRPTAIITAPALSVTSPPTRQALNSGAI